MGYGPPQKNPSNQSNSQRCHRQPPSPAYSGHCISVNLHWRSLLTHLICDCRKSCPGRIARNVANWTRLTRILQTEWETFPWTTKPGAVITASTVVNSLYTDDIEICVIINLWDDASSHNSNFCFIARKISEPRDTQATVLVNWQGARLMTIDFHGKPWNTNVPWRCSVKWTYPLEMSEVYIPDITAKPGSVYELMILASALNAARCIKHVRGDEPFMLEMKIPIRKWCTNLIPILMLMLFTINSLERRDEKGDRHNVVNKSL